MPQRPRRPGRRRHRSPRSLPAPHARGAVGDGPAAASRPSAPAHYAAIAPGIYVGRHPSEEHVRELGLTMVVLCAESLQTGSYPGAKVVRAPMVDESPARKEDLLDRALAAAHTAAAEIRRGGRVYFGCAAGINRSALVCALSLVLFTGCKGQTAIEMIRAARGSGALFNPSFEAFVLRFSRAHRAG